MKCLTKILMLFLMFNAGWTLYPANNCVQEQQLLKENIIKQQLQLLQQQLQLIKQQYAQGRHDRPTNLNIILTKSIIDDFEYIPTVQGYRFSYQLSDGSRRKEIAFITGLRMDEYSHLDSKTADFTEVGVGGRPKINLKNRKLSPGSLKSLAG